MGWRYPSEYVDPDETRRSLVAHQAREPSRGQSQPPVRMLSGRLRVGAAVKSARSQFPPLEWSSSSKLLIFLTTALGIWVTAVYGTFPRCQLGA